MQSFLEEFKAFAMRGNVVDLAVAVVIGGAFGKITTSLVDNIIMPLIGILLGGVSFGGLSVKVGSAVVAYGAFLQSVIDFIIIAFAIFVFIKVLNRLQAEEEAKPEAEKVVEPPEEVKLLREIRDAVKRGG